MKKNLVFIPLLIALCLLFVNINKPFIGLHDFNGAQEGNAAKNYLKYGLIKTKFGQIIGKVSGNVEDNKSFYTSYLPLTPLLVALSFWIFGVSDWAARLVPIVFSLGQVVFLYLIVKELWGDKIGLLSGIFYIFTPMFIYFGTIPVPEPLILFFSLGAIFYYLKWIKYDKKFDFNLLVVFIFLGGLAGWPIGYLIPIFFVHSFLLKKFSKKLFIPLVVYLFTVALLIVHGSILSGKIINSGMFSVLERRLAEKNLNFGGTSFNLLNYLKQQISWFQAYFTRMALVLSFLCVLLYIKKKLDLQISVLLLFLLFGVAHPLIFPRMVFIHEYLNIYLLPFISITAALGLVKILDFLITKRVNLSVVTLVFVLIMSLFITERFKFIQALWKTDMNKSGKEMADILNSYQLTDNQALILSPRFEQFYRIFTDYYSNYSFKIMSWSDFKVEYVNYYPIIITIDEDIENKDAYTNLISRYKSEKKGDITIIKTNERL